MTDISQQNIIGELGEKCLRSRCYDPVVAPPVPGPVGGPPSVPIIAPVAGAFSGYMKAKETGSVKAELQGNSSYWDWLLDKYIPRTCLYS